MGSTTDTSWLSAIDAPRWADLNLVDTVCEDGYIDPWFLRLHPELNTYRKKPKPLFVPTPDNSRKRRARPKTPRVPGFNDKSAKRAADRQAASSKPSSTRSASAKYAAMRTPKVVRSARVSNCRSKTPAGLRKSVISKAPLAYRPQSWKLHGAKTPLRAAKTPSASSRQRTNVPKSVNKSNENDSSVLNRKQTPGLAKQRFKRKRSLGKPIRIPVPNAATQSKTVVSQNVQIPDIQATGSGPNQSTWSIFRVFSPTKTTASREKVRADQSSGILGVPNQLGPVANKEERQPLAVGTKESTTCPKPSPEFKIMSVMEASPRIDDTQSSVETQESSVLHETVVPGGSAQKVVLPKLSIPNSFPAVGLKSFKRSHSSPSLCSGDTLSDTGSGAPTPSGHAAAGTSISTGSSGSPYSNRGGRARSLSDSFADFLSTLRTARQSIGTSIRKKLSLGKPMRVAVPEEIEKSGKVEAKPPRLSRPSSVHRPLPTDDCNVTKRHRPKKKGAAERASSVEARKRRNSTKSVLPGTNKTTKTPRSLFNIGGIFSSSSSGAKKKTRRSFSRASRGLVPATNRPRSNSVPHGKLSMNGKVSVPNGKHNASKKSKSGKPLRKSVSGTLKDIGSDLNYNNRSKPHSLINAPSVKCSNPAGTPTAKRQSSSTVFRQSVSGLETKRQAVSKTPSRKLVGASRSISTRASARKRSTASSKTKVFTDISNGKRARSANGGKRSALGSRPGGKGKGAKCNNGGKGGKENALSSKNNSRSGRKSLSRPAHSAPPIGRINVQSVPPVAHIRVQPVPPVARIHVQPTFCCRPDAAPVKAGPKGASGTGPPARKKGLGGVGGRAKRKFGQDISNMSREETNGDAKRQKLGHPGFGEVNNSKPLKKSVVTVAKSKSNFRKKTKIQRSIIRTRAATRAEKSKKSEKPLKSGAIKRRPSDFHGALSAHGGGGGGSLKRRRQMFDYVPRQHSLRDIKKWESENGLKWSGLSPRGRQLANQDISSHK
eukprot:706555_1